MIHHFDGRTNMDAQRRLNDGEATTSMYTVVAWVFRQKVNGFRHNQNGSSYGA